ncbi:LD-carboxypeptidase [Actinomadura sp. 21ATH]|uniref:S66 peptidase family protein n=1 Tax=Actinomadura sp. 21ATH TaxID=1735444 RepID=UPI0035C0D1C7
MSGVARAGAEDDRRSVSDRPLDRTPGSLSEARPDPVAGPDAAPRRFARLRPGDRVAVIAPSGPVDPVRLKAGCDVLRDLGLEVTVGEHALDRVPLGPPGVTEGSEGTEGAGWQRLAGEDADRAADLVAAWCDPEVRAVLCARGGYGATRLLGLIDWDKIIEAGRGTAPKILHGSSDVTALHAAFARRLGITTSFGPMTVGELLAEGAGEREQALRHLRAVLFGPEAGEDGTGATDLTGDRVLRAGRAEGLLTGGTLALLAALLGTPDAPPPAAGRIVFLEDVGEAPYRIDRMLTQLLRAGWFDGAAGIVLGPWHDCGDPAELDAVVAGRLGPLGVPILAGVPAGHGPRQLTLELGAPYRLDTGTLTLAGPPPPGSDRADGPRGGLR